jgi:branched-chain amino acid transport system substrate-binding protein
VRLPALLITLALAAAGCSSAAGPSGARAAQGSVKFVLTADFSGPESFAGKVEAPIFQLACAQINRAGGVLGNRCAVVNVDDKSDPADGAVALRQALATNANVVAVSGLSTTCAGSEIPIVIGAHIVALATSGATAYLHPATAFGSSSRYVYMMLQADEMLGYAFTFGARALHMSHPAVVVTDTPDTASTLAGVTSADAAIGIRPSIVIKIAPGQASYGTEVQRIVASHPDGLILNLTDPQSAGTFLSNLVTAMGVIRLPMLSDQTFLQSDFYSAIKADIPAATLRQHLHIVTTAPADSSNPGLAPLATTWPTLNLGQLDTTFTAPLYDGVILTALAIQAAHSLDPSVFAPYIARIAASSSGLNGRVRVDTYAQGIRLLKLGKKIAYWGAYGPLNWTSQHVRAPDFNVSSWTLGSSGPSAAPGGISLSGTQIAAKVGL